MLGVPPGSCSLRDTPEAGGYGGQGKRVDERFRCPCAALDPLRRRLPAHPGCVSGRYVIDVEELFVASLLSPHLASGIDGIGKDGSNGGVRPASWITVAVTHRVVRGRGWNCLIGETLRDGAEAVTGRLPLEDSFLDWRADRVRL